MYVELCIVCLLCVGAAYQLTATAPRRKKRGLSEGERQARKRAEERRAYQSYGDKDHMADNELSSENEEDNLGRHRYVSKYERSDSLEPRRPSPTPHATGITHTTQQQQPTSAQLPNSAGYASVLDKLHEFEASDDEDDSTGPISQAAQGTTSAQHQSPASGINTASGENSRGSQTLASSTTQQSHEHRQTNVVVEQVHQPTVSHTSGSNGPISPPSSNSTIGRNGAVAGETAADAISGGESSSSESSQRSGLETGSSPRSSGGHAQQYWLAGGKDDTLSDLVRRGIGSELLNCIDLPLGYQELDAKVDSFCINIKKKGITYPNHPTQTACQCLNAMWLSPVIAGTTKLRSLMGIPQVADLNLLRTYIRDAVESPNLMRVWRYPSMEANSCIFGHQFEALVEMERLETSALITHAEAERRDQILKRLRFLLLLSQRQVVDSAMLGFLLSLFRMDRCKQSFKTAPKYRTPDGNFIDAKGLFQALLADAIANMFILDLQRCNTPEAMETGTKANVLCAHLIQDAKVRATLKPILSLVANEDLEGARQKAETFAQDLQKANEDWEDIEATQAVARVHAALSVSLSFALSSWKGKLANWLSNQRPLRLLLRKVLGEVTALIFEGNAEAARFGVQVTSVEEDATVTSGALFKYAQMQVMRVAAEARFFCQTGYKGLGKAVGSSLKTVTRSLARAEIGEDRQQGNGHNGSSSGQSFSEVSSSVDLMMGARRYPMNMLNLTVHDSFPSFLSTRISKKPRRIAGSVMALVGAVSGKKLKSALKKIEVKGRRVFADANFLKRRWWSVLAGIVRRLRTSEQMALPLIVLLSIHFFVVSVSFAAVATVATQAIGAFCVVVVVLMMLDLLQLGASLNLP
ncbi:hypothetical protein, conserved [Eimeria brunetti]|uniref:Uncharacterized protein n=1 Tax=Eimeria brunetti TaxID=51314 RepID=U6LVN5_9EIME|nr:hypothetical protein, conserved [Eimeria brunetti]